MKFEPKRLLTKAVTVTTLFCMTAQPTFAALLSLAQEPLTSSGVPPKVMLTISKDQQLYKKAYNDYSNLDEDPAIETTYKHTIRYYGYFDPFKCYEYSGDVFHPRSKQVIDGPVNSAGNVEKLPGLCNGSQWSGNFLNWVSMSRMDAVRKLLYGGLRSTDETYDAATRPVPVTILERSYLPTDAHAWAKHYNPNPSTPSVTPPIDRLTPFSTTVTAPTEIDATSTNGAIARDFTIPSGTGDYVMRFDRVMSHVRLGDQVRIQSRSNADHYFIAVVIAIGSGGTRLTLRFDPPAGDLTWGQGQDHMQWKVVNLSSTGISFCNLTTGSTTAGNVDAVSSTNTRPPLIRVAKGNFGLWSANEKWQCYWNGERSFLQNGFVGGTRSNGNRAAVSEIHSSAENPIQSEHGLGTGLSQGEYVVRVRVCDPTLYDEQLNAEGCKRYPNGNLKPVGLLQQYGDDGGIEFGLMTGSHAKNISGGVLRKNPGPLSDEVRVNSDGAFQEADGATPRQPYRPRAGRRDRTSAESPAGIINTLNYMRIYGYQYTIGSYQNAAGDDCTFQLTSITENTCTSWGNPMSEVFFEAVRYFAGKDATPAYTYTPSGSKDNELGLPLAKAVDPLTENNYCANMNVLVVNASVSDNDTDLGGVSGDDINSREKIVDLTNIVGNGSNEKINGKSYFVGKIVGDAVGPNFELCTSKTVTTFGDASGICPEGPTTAGSYHIAGIAYHAKTNRIRKPDDPMVKLARPDDTKVFKVTTYAVQLASNTPQLEIKAGNQRVVIQPIYRLDLSRLSPAPAEPFGGGGLVDMRYVRTDDGTNANLRSGKVYVNWEDSEQGGDYDQDMWGTIEWLWDVPNKKITITTNAVSASTRNPQGFGYSISGTAKQDGPHFHSGIYGFNYPLDGSGFDATGVRGCVNCNLVGSGGQTGKQAVTYDISDEPNTTNVLKDPLWYAAKYGGFEESGGTAGPDRISEWDRIDNTTGEGTTTGDGNPDNYFLVTNPLKLADSLAAAFARISGNSSGTAVMANSTSLSTTDRIYQARFNGTDWSGRFIAKKVTTEVVNGQTRVTISDVADAADMIPKPASSRLILTFDDAITRDGVLFEKDTISANLLLELNKSPVTGSPDGLGLDRLEWLRGSPDKEVRRGGMFRNRNSTVLGDISGSDPSYVGPPNASRLERAYGDFRLQYFNRTPMIYVGANDGAVHGFDARTMEEKIAYVPSKVHSHLAKLTSTSYAHRFYVDGPTETTDAVVNGAWRTVLIGGLGGGGQGIYALDVTDPSRFARGNEAEIVMWEFNDTDDVDLGYVYGKPVIRQMADNRWAAIVSGGYNNSEGDTAVNDDSTRTKGHAFLYIIFLDGPSGGGRTWREGIDYIKIDTGVGDATTPNGLASPFVADVTADGKADYIYAGDRFGNMWKFDVRDRNPANWALPANRVVLFKAVDDAGNAQPITSAADGTLHPTGKGYVIAFGTGKFLEPSDVLPATFRTQSYYGIWDKNVTPVEGQQIVTRAELLDQPITEAGTSPSGLPLRTVPNASPNWDNPHLGWRMDFPRSDVTGERVVFRPLLFSSRLIFTTLTPTEKKCDGGGTSMLMIVDPTTGGRINSVVIDTDGNGVLNDVDRVGGAGGVAASGIQSAVGITPTPVVVRGAPAIDKTDTNSKIYATPAPYLAGQGGTALGFTFMGGPLGITGTWIGLGADSGRVSWREIIN